MKDHPLVSIVTPCYNAISYLPETVASVKAQTYPHWEWWIVDDGSLDGSQRYLSELMKTDSRIRVLYNDQNQGPARTRNRGIEQANGTYLTFIDADDLWEPNFLHHSLTCAQKQKVPFVFSSYARKDEKLKPLLPDFIVPSRVSYKDLLKTCPISNLTAFFNVKITGKHYMPDIPKRQDYALWLALLKKIPYAYGINKVMATYRIRKGSVSRNKLSSAYYQFLVYLKYERLSLPVSIYYTFHWGLNGLKKYHFSS